MNSKSLTEANKILKAELIGAKLDRFVVSSLELCLCFMTDRVPMEEIWLTTTSKISLGEPSDNDFFAQRAIFLSQVYGLIGESIEQINIDSSGQLIVLIDSKNIIVMPDDESLEEVWSVTPYDYAQFKDHEWFVSYSDSGELTQKTKES